MLRNLWETVGPITMLFGALFAVSLLIDWIVPDRARPAPETPSIWYKVD